MGGLSKRRWCQGVGSMEMLRLGKGICLSSERVRRRILLLNRTTEGVDLWRRRFGDDCAWESATDDGL